MTPEQKVEAVREVLRGLGDPEFWNLDTAEVALDRISDIVDPEIEAPDNEETGAGHSVEAYRG